MERFGTFENVNVQYFPAKSKNENTEKCTNKWMNCFKAWAKYRGKPVEIETLLPAELDVLLQHFYAEVKKKDGSDYEPNSLASMQAGIDRYLRGKKYEHSVLNSREFSVSRAVLEGKA